MQPWTGLPRLLQGLADRSSTMRSRAMEYILLLLESLPVFPEEMGSPFHPFTGAALTFPYSFEMTCFNSSE